MKKAILILGLFFCLLTITVNVVIEKERSYSDLNITFLSQKILADGESSATVPCKDTENYGSGGLRARICLHGTIVFCNYEDYKLPATDGTCTINN